MSVCAPNIKIIFVSVCAPNIKIIFVSVRTPNIKNDFRECLCSEYEIIIFGSVCAVNEIYYTACFKVYNLELCFQ